MSKDPVCGMEIDPASAFAIRQHMGQPLHFCSKQCVDVWDAKSGRRETSLKTGTKTVVFNPKQKGSDDDE